MQETDYTRQALGILSDGNESVTLQVITLDCHSNIDLEKGEDERKLFRKS